MIAPWSVQYFFNRARISLVSAIGLPFEQSKECLVYEGRALQRVVRALRLEVVVRQAPKFLVNHGCHRSKRILVPLDPLLQQLADLTRIFLHQASRALVALSIQTIRAGRGRQSPCTTRIMRATRSHYVRRTTRPISPMFRDSSRRAVLRLSVLNPPDMAGTTLDSVIDVSSWVSTQ